MTIWIHSEKKSGLRAYLKAAATTTIAATSWLALTTSPALAADCVSPKEDISLQTRTLQTELMVAALTCNEAARYNAFVKSYRPQLMESHTDISGYFKRTNARGAETELNSFMTKLANASSLRSAQDKASFCANAKEIFNATLKPGGVDLTSYVQTVDAAQTHGLKACQRDAKAPTPRDKPGRSRFSFFKKNSN